VEKKHLCCVLFTRRVRKQQHARCVVAHNLTGRLHVPIVRPTGRSDPGYVRLSVRPVGQTSRTDCSRTAHICQSNQCGLLVNYNTAYAAAWLVVPLASRTDQSDRPVGTCKHPVSARKGDRRLPPSTANTCRSLVLFGPETDSHWLVASVAWTLNISVKSEQRTSVRYVDIYQCLQHDTDRTTTTRATRRHRSTQLSTSLPALLITLFTIANDWHCVVMWRQHHNALTVTEMI